MLVLKIAKISSKSQNPAKYKNNYKTPIRKNKVPHNACQSWWGCAAQFSKSRPYFRPKNAIFHTRFQPQPLRNYDIIP